MCSTSVALVCCHDHRGGVLQPHPYDHYMYEVSSKLHRDNSLLGIINMKVNKGCDLSSKETMAPRRMLFHLALVLLHLALLG